MSDLRLSDLCKFVGYETVKSRKHLEKKTIEIHLKRKESYPRLCSRCGCSLAAHRGGYFMRVKHLPVFDFKVVLILYRQKGDCPCCRKARAEQIEFLAEESPHLTREFVFWAAELSEISTPTRVGQFIGVGKVTMWRIENRHLKRLMKRYRIPPAKRISVDEVYARKKDHYPGESRMEKFFTVITDLDRRKVIWVSDGRRKESLDEFFKKIGPKGCERIKVVASDEHNEYRKSIEEFCPKAKHTLDKFHLLRHFEEAVDKTRNLLFKLAVPGSLARRKARHKDRFIYIKRGSKRTTEETCQLEDVMSDNKMFFELELIKERILTMFDATVDVASARAIFEEVGAWIFEAGFPALKKWYRKTFRIWPKIEAYFIERATSSMSEGFNNVIKALKRRAFGYKDMDYFKHKILQVCGYLKSCNFDKNGFIPARGI